MSGRLVVLISGSGSNMVALINACRAGEVPGDVVAVIADRQCAGLAKADDLDTRTELIEPAAFPTREEWNVALRDAVAKYEPDLVVSAGFMRILAPVFVDEFAGRLVNLHPSLLPAFPGAQAVRDAMDAGVKVTGTTIHHIDHEVDHGEIVAQEAVPIHADDTEATLHERIKEAERRLLPGVCKALLEARPFVLSGTDHFKILSEMTTDVAYVFDFSSDGKITLSWANGLERSLGYTPEEFETVGGWLAAVHPDDVAMAEESISRLFEGHPQEIEIRVVTTDGEVRWRHARTRPVYDEEAGRVVRVYGATSDITERKRLEQRLSEAQRMDAVGRLAGGIAHDFNNLLMVILNSARFIEDELPTDSPQLDDARSIIESGERAADLVRQLLTYSRRHCGERAVVDVNDIIEETKELLRHSLGTGISFECTLAKDLWPTLIAPADVQQVLMNLLANAREAMPNGGAVTIETSNAQVDGDLAERAGLEQSGRFVCVMVTDTGVGISDELLPRIFEPFYSTRPKAEAGGLGLSTVQGIVTQAGGRVMVESALGTGTTFRVYLPAVEAAD